MPRMTATPSAIKVCRFICLVPRFLGGPTRPISLRVRFYLYTILPGFRRANVGADAIRTAAPEYLANAGSRAVDTSSSLIHRVADRVSKTQGRNGDDRADNGEDQRIFSSRGTALVAQHVDEVLHSPSPYASAPRALNGPP